MSHFQTGVCNDKNYRQMFGPAFSQVSLTKIISHRNFGDENCVHTQQTLLILLTLFTIIVFMRPFPSSEPSRYIYVLLVFSRDRSFQPRHRDDDRTLRVSTAQDHVEYRYSSFCNSTYFMRLFQFLSFSNTHFYKMNCWSQYCII